MSAHEFDLGPVAEPFVTIAADYPGVEVYPAQDFRVEWGPIFHRGRLDGSARILVIGQDPGQHESIAHRCLVGEAGQRVQGFLAKLGITRSYVIVNAFLYSVFGQHAGERHVQNRDIAAYRERWLNELLLGSQITVVVSFGHIGASAYRQWASKHPARASELIFEALTHPTMPEAASHGDPAARAAAMKTLLTQWNVALTRLDDQLGERDIKRPLVLYGEDITPAERSAIPSADLPLGAPAWWSSLKPWASREGSEVNDKRATVVVRVPEGERPWQTAPAPPQPTADT